MKRGCTAEEYRRFYHDVGERYPEEKIVYSTLRGMLRKEFVRKMTAGWTGTVLDAGCGGGIHLKRLSGNVAVGLDISVPVLKRAKAYTGKSLICADIAAAECFKPASFDYILLSEVLEHVPDPLPLIRHLHSLLKPSGKILITVPNYSGSKPEWIETGILDSYNISGMDSGRYFHTAYTPDELSDMLIGTGFNILEKGTLEKEIKYAAKLPAAVKIVADMINGKVIGSEKFAEMNRLLFEYTGRLILSAIDLFNLREFLNKRVKEGVRSYILGKKI